MLTPLALFLAAPASAADPAHPVDTLEVAYCWSAAQVTASCPTTTLQLWGDSALASHGVVYEQPPGARATVQAVGSWSYRTLTGKERSDVVLTLKLDVKHPVIYVGFEQREGCFDGFMKTAPTNKKTRPMAGVFLACPMGR